MIHVHTNIPRSQWAGLLTLKFSKDVSVLICTLWASIMVHLKQLGLSAVLQWILANFGFWACTTWSSLFCQQYFSGFWPTSVFELAPLEAACFVSSTSVDFGQLRFLSLHHLKQLGLSAVLQWILANYGFWACTTWSSLFCQQYFCGFWPTSVFELAPLEAACFVSSTSVDFGQLRFLSLHHLKQLGLSAVLQWILANYGFWACTTWSSLFCQQYFCGSWPTLVFELAPILQNFTKLAQLTRKNLFFTHFHKICWANLPKCRSNFVTCREHCLPSMYVNWKTSYV